jgi:CHAT domain-containing protein
VLQYSVGEKEGWLLILTREGVTAHNLAIETRALPELLPRQQATLAQLMAAWKTRKDKIGLDGLVQLARGRVEDLGKREAERQNLIDASTEKAILERLGRVVLPDSAQVELRRKKTAHLLVSPDGSLHYVPFGMLRIKGGKGSQYLIEQYAISSVPAMTTLETIGRQKAERQARRKGPVKDLLAFANPDFGTQDLVVASSDERVARLRSLRGDYYKDTGLKRIPLPETEQEAMRVASLFGTPKEYRSGSLQWPEGMEVVYTGKGASEDQVKRLLETGRSEGGARPSWRYIMFSTHGLVDVRNGMLSCLALSSPEAGSEEDGYLQAQEVMGLELDTDLVMLSACQTGLGRLSGGEGLVGLTGSFFYAGAESVCASLWQVPSGPTSQMIMVFFKALKEGKLSRAEALRQAQLKVMHEGRTPDGKTADYSNPFCWAAWGLFGEWQSQ